jgi:hypothetical protein
VQTLLSIATGEQLEDKLALGQILCGCSTTQLKSLYRVSWRSDKRCTFFPPPKDLDPGLHHGLPRSTRRRPWISDVDVPFFFVAGNNMRAICELSIMLNDFIFTLDRHMRFKVR